MRSVHSSPVMPYRMCCYEMFQVCHVGKETFPMLSAGLLWISNHFNVNSLRKKPFEPVTPHTSLLFRHQVIAQRLQVVRKRPCELCGAGNL